MLSALISHAKLLLASTYGSGVYGSGTYNNTTASTTGGGVVVGPITLPVTGAGLLVIVGAIAVAAAIGWFVWLRQQRAKAAPVSTEA